MKNSLIFSFYYCGSYRGLFGVKKAEFFQSFSHSAYTDAVVIRDKRRSETDNNRVAAFQEDFRLFGFVNYFFRVLGTYHKTLSAKNTLVSDNMSLIPREPNGLYRAVANTLIAIFTI